MWLLKTQVHRWRNARYGGSAPMVTIIRPNGLAVDKVCLLFCISAQVAVTQDGTVGTGLLRVRGWSSRQVSAVTAVLERSGPQQVWGLLALKVVTVGEPQGQSFLLEWGGLAGHGCCQGRVKGSVEGLTGLSEGGRVRPAVLGHPGVRLVVQLLLPLTG